MAVSKRSKSEAKHGAIMAAASKLFLGSGYEITSMDKVAVEAGVSKQTVYSHFSNKEALFSAVVEYKCEMYGLRPDLFDTNKSCPENLLTYATQICEMLVSEDAVKVDRLCSSNAEERPELARLFFESGPSKVKELLYDYIASQADAGTLKIPDVTLATSFFLHAAQADAVPFARWGVSDRNQQNTQQYLNLVVDIFMQYYGAE